MEMLKRLASWLNRWHEPNKPAPVLANDEADADGLADPFTEPVELEITDVLDLHAIPPKQVQAVVEEYLFQTRARGFSVLRIIHGKGQGVQREMVRKLLARTAYVKCFYDAPPEAGGWGATIAEFTAHAPD